MIVLNEYDKQHLSGQDVIIQPHIDLKNQSSDDIQMGDFNTKDLSTLEESSSLMNAETFFFPMHHTIGSPCKELNDDSDNSNNLDNDEAVCRELTIPLDLSSTSKIPLKCRPRLVILPSYPTSANGLTQRILKRSIGAETFANDRDGKVIYDWGDFELKTNGYRICQRGLQLPFAGRAAIMKTHQKASKDISSLLLNKADKNRNVTERVDDKLPSHIIRLARNPGDHLIRNAARWANDDHSNHESFFEEEGGKACGVALRNSKEWVTFHESWHEMGKQILSIVLRFEEIMNLDIVDEKISEVIYFIEEDRYGVVNYDDEVKPPSYEQGTLMRDICGIEVARTIHERTKHVSADLGYSFDPGAGTWSISRNGNSQ